MATPSKGDQRIKEAHKLYAPSLEAHAILQNARARTGFDSYHAFLRFHNEDTTPLARLCGPLRLLSNISPAARCLDGVLEYQLGSAVLNVSKQGQLSAAVDAAYYHG